MERVARLNGAFVESIAFAHGYAPDAALRERYARYLQTGLVEPTLKETRQWWHHGAGRSALNLYGLAYYAREVEASPELQAAIYHALCRMFSPDMTRSIPALIADGVQRPEWIYISFGTLGLAEWLVPGLTSHPGRL